MRKPKLSEFDDGDGNGPDFEAYEDVLGQYEDSERDRYLEEECERKDKKERMADYSDQDQKDIK